MDQTFQDDGATVAQLLARTRVLRQVFAGEISVQDAVARHPDLADALPGPVPSAHDLAERAVIVKWVRSRQVSVREAVEIYPDLVGVLPDPDPASG